MKKRILILSMLTLFIHATSWAYDFSAENADGVTIYYNIFSSSDMTCEVTYLYYNSSSNSEAYSGAVSIPETITYNETTYTVTEIGEYAFRSCTGLTSVVIPNSVTEIGSYAFRNCTGLTQVTIPESVTTIGNQAFYQCTGLTKVNFNATACTSAWSLIIDSPFYDCDNITTFNFGDNVTIIPDDLCDGLTGLTGELTIPNSVTEIGSYAFRDCTGLTEVSLGNSVTSIGYCAFSGCTGLTKVNFNATACTSDWSYVSNRAFYGCDSISTFNFGDNVTLIPSYLCDGLTSLEEITIPNSVTMIDREAFRDCTGLKTLTLKEGEETLTMTTSSSHTPFSNCPIEVLHLGRDVSYSSSYSPFRDNTKLTSLTIGNGVTEIPSYEFYGCSGLKGTLTIPESVTKIDSQAFSDCKRLTGLILEDGEETLTMTTSSSSTPFSNCPIEVLHLGRDVSYSSSYSPFRDNTSLTSLTIGSRVTEIPSHAFYKCLWLGTLTIPESVTKIGTYAFYNCSSLRQLDFNATACTSVSSGTFLQCNISTVNFGDNVALIPSYLCDRMTKLTKIDIPNSVTSIGSYAFRDCTGLTEVTIGNSVTEIGSYAFYDCSSLRGELTFPESVTEIGSYAFYNCSSLKGELVIPNGMTAISNYTFYNCSRLTEITIPNSVTTIGSDAFCGCSGLTSITIPNSVTKIDSQAFYNCTGLTSVTIGNSVTTIGDGAFAYCYGLTEIAIPNSVTTIGGAFGHCTGLKQVTIGNSVTEIGSGAFYYCTGLTDVTIPNSVTSIGSSAFRDCTGLTSIYSLNPEPPTCSSAGIIVFYNVNTRSCTLYVPEGTKEAYSTADQWKDFLNIVDNQPNAIDDIANNGNTKAVGYYTTDGKQVPTLQKGVNIIRYSDGTTKKVLVK